MNRHDMTSEIYFDNSATTVCTKEVADAVTQAMLFSYGNPSSKHLKGVQAEQIVRDARDTIAGTIRCSEKEIYFTSGGTESDNWALFGAAGALRRAGDHIIVSSIEHPAVLEAAARLEKDGFRVTYLPVDEKGYVRLEDLEKALDEQTILVSVMHVNNEVGSVQPVEAAASMTHAACPHALFHVDAVQSYGKIPINVRHLGADLISVSGHKIHGPKGTGFLYVKEKARILPLIVGGGQQKGMRSGTDNVPGIAGLACAALSAADNLEENTARMRQVRDRLFEGLGQMEDVVLLSGTGEKSAPHIVNAAFTGVRSEVLLHALEDRGIFVSAGSACSSNKKLPVSPVLTRLGIPRNQAESALRFSFSAFNTVEEADRCLEVLREFLPVLRKYTRR